MFKGVTLPFLLRLGHRLGVLGILEGTIYNVEQISSYKFYKSLWHSESRGRIDKFW